MCGTIGDLNDVLADGIYAVSQEGLNSEFVSKDPSDFVITYDRRYAAVSAEEGGQPEYLALDRSSWVPLTIEGEPSTSSGGNGITMLSVKLSRNQAKPLEDLTRRQLNGKVAIVLDGEVITKHKVRSVVTGGNLQIARCGDDACQILRAKLVD
ncbi:MAG: hypothetical protein AAF485_30440 [Chloroflexota bacterium]